MRRFILASLGVASVATLVLVATTPLDAQRVGPRGPNGPDGRRPAFAAAQARGGGPVFGVRAGRRGGAARMADRLELTTEQRDAIATISQESRDTITPLADELRLAENNLRRAIFADTPDVEAVETLSAQVAALHQQIAEARVQAQVAVAAQMTEEQRAEMRAAPRRGGSVGGPAGRSGRGGPGQRARS